MVEFHDQADDILQNTFIKVYKAIDKFEGRSELYTWLYRIATNESLNHLKSSHQRKTKLHDVEAFSTCLAKDQYFNGDEIQLLLKKAIFQLPAKQKQVFIMRYYDDISYAQMSKVLDTSIGGLKASYHHAVKKIEVILKNENYVF